MKKPCTTLIIVTLLCCMVAGEISAKEISLRFAWWGSKTRAKVTNDAIALYMKKNPGVTITGEIAGSAQELRTRLGKGLRDGSAPDIFQYDVAWIYDISDTGTLLRDYLQDLRAFRVDESGFDTRFLNEWCVYGNRLIGLPTGVNGSTFLAQSALLQKFHITQSIVWNWDNFLETGSRVHKADTSYHLYCASYNHLFGLLKSYALNQTGGEWIGDDYRVKIDRLTLAKTFRYFLRLRETGTIPPFEETLKSENKFENYPKWRDGKIVMIGAWTSLLDNLKKKGVQYTIMVPPYSEGAKNTGIVVRPSQLLSTYKNSPNVHEAVKFVQWFVNDPAAILILGDTRGIPAFAPARKILTDNRLLDRNLSNATMTSVMNAGAHESSLNYTVGVTEMMKDMLLRLERGKISPEDAASRYIEKAQQELNRLRTRAGVKK